jgi:hypothetical protein
MVLFDLGLARVLSMTTSHTHHRSLDHEKVLRRLPLELELLNVLPLHVEVLLPQLLSLCLLPFLIFLFFRFLFLHLVFNSLIFTDFGFQSIVPLNPSQLCFLISFHLLLELVLLMLYPHDLLLKFYLFILLDFLLSLLLFLPHHVDLVRVQHATTLVHWILHRLLAVDEAVVLGAHSHRGEVVPADWDHARLLPWTVVAILGARHHHRFARLWVDDGLIKLGWRTSTAEALAKEVGLDHHLLG